MNQSSLRFRRWVSCVALMMLGLVTACGSSGDNGGAAPGSLSVSLTDAPACGFDQVNVTVSKVRVHQSSSADDTAAGWTDITVNPPRKINLLDFNDPTQPIQVQPLGLSPLERSTTHNCAWSWSPIAAVRLSPFGCLVSHNR